MAIDRFEDLTVWQKAMELSEAIHSLTKTSSLSRDLALRDQMWRAAISVSSNVAEGFKRYSRAEFRHLLSVARGSAGELRSQLHLARRIGYLDDDAHSDLNRRCLELSKLLAALRASLQ